MDIEAASNLTLVGFGDCCIRKTLQRPVGVPLILFPPIAASQIHTLSIRTGNGISRGLVFTRALTGDHAC
jgi:hypothetical protein